MAQRDNFTLGGNISALTNASVSNSTSEDPVTVKVLKTFCYCVIMLMSLVGNTLVITIIYRNKRMRTTTNKLIANMATSDLLFPLFAVPRETAEILIGKSRWLVGGVGGGILCKIVNFAQDISTAVSILSLVVIAFDRFYAVKFPFKRAIITPKMCHIIVAVIWSVAIGIHSPYFYTFRLKTVQNHLFCVNEWEPAFDSVPTQIVYFLIIFVVLISLPIAIITVLYAAIAIEVWKQKGPVERSCQERQRRENENRKVLKQVVTVVVVFVACITPITIFGCLVHFVWNLQFPREIGWSNFRFSALFIMHSSAAISPCIYFIFNKNYRKGFKEIVQSCTRMFSGVTPSASDKTKIESRVEHATKQGTPRCQYI